MLNSNRILLFSCFFFAGLALIAFGLSLLDSTQITGLNRWYKPLKFMLSMMIYTGTMIFYVYWVPASLKFKEIASWTAALTMIGESVLLFTQAIRGVPSHFNTTTIFDMAVFASMGILINLNLLMIVFMAILYWVGRPALSPVLTWAFRLSFIPFMLSNIEGALMVARLAHTVGAMDGSTPGLPFLNWSTKVGDLRPAHFWGMHSLQVFPIAGWMIDLVKFPPIWIVIFLLIYLIVFFFYLAQALLGMPLLSI
ncbi:MAG: hypothetical protein SFT81_05355 [Candidatus Caenarcaniphilales bacterium]|nr:hypothetical protein [Candidatus Caenarcaniphilales bacterium]